MTTTLTTLAAQARCRIAPYFETDGLAARDRSEVRALVGSHGGVLDLMLRLSDARHFVAPFGDGSYLVYTEESGFVEGRDHWTHPSGRRGIRYLPHWWGEWGSAADLTTESAAELADEGAAA